MKKKKNIHQPVVCINWAFDFINLYEICNFEYVFFRNLSNSSLKGFLAPELGQFSSLQELYVQRSSFTSSFW